jgi:hypothetical protein
VAAGEEVGVYRAQLVDQLLDVGDQHLADIYSRFQLADAFTTQ